MSSIYLISNLASLDYWPKQTIIFFYIKTTQSYMPFLLKALKKIYVVLTICVEARINNSISKLNTNVYLRWIRKRSHLTNYQFIEIAVGSNIMVARTISTWRVTMLVSFIQARTLNFSSANTKYNLYVQTIFLNVKYLFFLNLLVYSNMKSKIQINAW